MLEIIRDWLPLFLAGGNVMIFVIMKFNDLKHLDEDMKEIKKSLMKIDDAVCKVGERTASIEGKCKANHG